VSETECHHKGVESNFDILIHEKRSHLKDAFAEHQRSLEAIAEARTHLSELARGHGPDNTPASPEMLRDAEEQIRWLESEDRDAAARFNVDPPHTMCQSPCFLRCSTDMYS
jgi:hypothetical protein